MLIPRLSKLCVVAGLGLVPLLAYSHHSFVATFDVETINEVVGVVTEVNWRNPHVRFTLRTTDEQGEEAIYNIESHSLSIVRRMELPPDTLNVGDTIRIAGHPARWTENTMFVLHALLPSGEEVLFDPWGKPRWETEAVGANRAWLTSEDDAQGKQSGIFQVWSTSIATMEAWPFPEMFDPTLLNRYPLNDEAKAALAAFDPLTDMPTLNCNPKGMPTIMEQPYPMEIVMQGDDILLLLEEYDTIRTIHFGSQSPANHPPSLLGYSVGSWEGDTLVVETNHINWPFFNSVGIPLTEAVEIVERFIPTEDGKRLDYQLTVTDPGIFHEPVELTKFWLSLPDKEVRPYECSNVLAAG